ncbi:MAG: LptF/LptG family permease, partial [Phycisphaerae bacterium]|nr:LptF/LptG family permease [Phycisphaerae bacterium]
MIKTLHYYISRELAKVTLLALVAFTLVMTVFAIIEPLRKQGLATDQVLALISYTLPVMLSLTLPIAALFAATIVYGRFSQDNELLACRASGVATLTILKPALVLGGGVTIVTLLLMNFVTPKLAELMELAVKANIRAIAYQQLRTKDYYKMGRHLIRAESVDPEQKTLHGLVYAYTKKGDDVRFLVTPTAYVQFVPSGGDAYVVISMSNPAETLTGNYTVFQQKSVPVAIKLDNPAKEDPSWYDWRKMLTTLREPTENEEIKDRFEELRRRIAHDMLCRRVADEINAGRPYEGLRDPGRRYIVRAAGAELAGGGVVKLLSTSEGRLPAQRVQVEVLRNDEVELVYYAQEGRVIARWSPVSNCSI